MFVRQIQPKKTIFLCVNFRPLLNKNVQMWNHFFPLLTPKDSESLKTLDIRLREVGEKRPLNGTSKVNTQTDRQTQILTFWLLESIGPEGWCFENYCSAKLLQLGTWSFETMYTTPVCQVLHVKCHIPFVTSRVMGCMTSLLQNWSKTGPKLV